MFGPGSAIDAETKLIPSWLVGGGFVARIQLTNGLTLYLTVVDSLMRGKADYAVLHKLYGGTTEDQRRYSPAVVTGVEGRVIMGNPDPDKVSTSYVERQNLTMRMGMRRFTRLTNGFSKKVENLAYAVSLYYLHYNFARPHQSLGKGVTPAMAAGKVEHPWIVWDIATLID